MEENVGRIGENEVRVGKNVERMGENGGGKERIWKGWERMR